MVLGWLIFWAINPLNGLREDECTDAVVEGLPHRDFTVLDELEGTVGDDRIADLDATLLSLLPARGTYIDEHVLLLDDLLPLLLCEDVRRLRRYDPLDVPLAPPDYDALPEKHLVEPASELVEGEEALVSHAGNNEADLVRVTGYENTWLVGATFGNEADGAELIGYHLVRVGRHVLLEEAVNLSLEAGGAESLHHILHKLHRFVVEQLESILVEFIDDLA